MCVLLFAGLVVVARRLGATVLGLGGRASSPSPSGAAPVCGRSAEAIAHPTARALWVDGHGWELVVASLLTLLLWGIGWRDAILREGAATVVVCALTFVAVLPLLDGTRTQVTLVALAVTLGWSLVAAATPPAWYVVPRVPLVAGALAALVTAATLAGLALESAVSVGQPFTERATVRLTRPDLPAHPLLLLATAAVLAVAALLASPRTRLDRPRAPAPGSASLVC